MKHERFLSLFLKPKPVIGMVHLGLLAGQKGFRGEQAVIEDAASDITALQGGGISGLILENWKENSVRPTVSLQRRRSMRRVVAALVPLIHVPFGINVLNNDYEAAYEIAAATGASFIQLDTFVDAVRSDFAYNEKAKAHPFVIHVEVPRVRYVAKSFGLSRLPILAGIHPKHYVMLDQSKSLEQSARQSQQRGIAGIVITKVTGQAPLNEKFERVRRAVDTPVGLGSGLDRKNVRRLLPLVDFAIVGTSVKKDGITQNPVDERRVRDLMRVVRSLQE